uniref:Uncharacterized protein n=1 Tax=Branchiostoma floridae TaxID=7739 RepID=C3ZGC6_BRAFL|eukprot:XP_002592436.1 hypothetical protein BRAFLDRAFT_67303 [Branchiostoma floridae]
MQLKGGTVHCCISLLPAVFNTARAFAVIGLLLLLPGVVVACFAAIKNSNKGKKYGGELIIAGGICGALAGAIYAGYAKSYAIAPGVSVPFGYSFYMIWVQALFTWVGGGVMTNAGSSDVQYFRTTDWFYLALQQGAAAAVLQTAARCLC